MMDMVGDWGVEKGREKYDGVETLKGKGNIRNRKRGGYDSSNPERMGEGRVGKSQGGKAVHEANLSAF